MDGVSQVTLGLTMLRLHNLGRISSLASQHCFDESCCNF